jgi:hypothetical protein
VGIELRDNLISSFHSSLTTLTELTGEDPVAFSNNCLARESLSPTIISWLDTYSTESWEVRNASCPATQNTMYFCGTYLADPTNWNEPNNWKSDVLCLDDALKDRPDSSDDVIVLSDISSNTGISATVGSLQVRGDAIIHIPIINNQIVTYPIPMSFLDTSVNASGNTLTGNANFACTAQNLGIVTGVTTFTQCTTPSGAPATASAETDTTPTFTGSCLNNTLVTLYNGVNALTPSVLCTGGAYSITTNLAPSETPYSITTKQSNRKGPTFGTSPASAALAHTVGCAA